MHNFELLLIQQVVQQSVSFQTRSCRISHFTVIVGASYISIVSQAPQTTSRYIYKSMEEWTSYQRKHSKATKLPKFIGSINAPRLLTTKAKYEIA